MTEPPHLRLCRRLDESPDDPIWPGDVHLDTFAEAHAAEVHALLQLAYADGGGSVPTFPEWWGSLSHDVEYDPDLCFPVRDGSGSLVGFAQCWTTGFVKDLVVHPRHRRRGIGRALLLHIFRVFRERGAEAVGLKVQSDNPSGAARFYESQGMIRISD